MRYRKSNNKLYKCLLLTYKKSQESRVCSRKSGEHQKITERTHSKVSKGTLSTRFFYISKV